jgi:hypothetical protein
VPLCLILCIFFPFILIFFATPSFLDFFFFSSQSRELMAVRSRYGGKREGPPLGWNGDGSSFGVWAGQMARRRGLTEAPGFQDGLTAVVATRRAWARSIGELGEDRIELQRRRECAASRWSRVL